MGRHRKGKEFKAAFNREDEQILLELARRERDRRKDPQVGVGTLLREFAMPLARARLAELKAQEETSSDRPGEERRVGVSERRLTEPAPTGA